MKATELDRVAWLRASRLHTDSLGVTGISPDSAGLFFLWSEEYAAFAFPVRYGMETSSLQTAPSIVSGVEAVNLPDRLWGKFS